MYRKILIMLSLSVLLLAGCSVRTGLDNANRNDFKMFKGKAVGVVTNHTALDSKGRHLVDLLHAAEDVKVQAIFAPEHGFRGDEEGGIHLSNNVDPKSGATIYSIYGAIRKPSREMLQGVDALIFDIQDVGARFYTYISTMGNIMEAGAEYGIPVYILDRPNPIGRQAEGPILQQEHKSFIGMYPIPIRHGMTVGELALMIRDRGWIENSEKLELHIVEISGWDPAKPYPKAKLEWIDPSPNMRNLNQALLYPGMCLFEASNFSDGRGTEHPFEWVGADYLDAAKVIEALQKREIKGLRITPVQYIPLDMPGYAMNPKYKEQTVNGLALTVTDPLAFRSVEFGVHLIDILHHYYPDQFVMYKPRMGRTFGNNDLYEKILDGKDAAVIISAYQDELTQFIAIRGKYLLY
ncbi:MAG: DUF1343 domain-containing protein [Candidatus Neomarinimicrobiota bacterium]|nr:DUF1343 domain-containing protein [Candidatus Neomarinimicrobiota bacterium]MDX9780604.1 DUF1343 domain-containing protein [bacterium]